MVYIDIQKAYDSVEYWALELVLEKYGFSEHFRDIIMISAKIRHVMSYRHMAGLSEQINITRGVKQGCPLSPTLFIIFLEPLMLLIEDSNKGYEIDNRKIPRGAYADDMVLHTNRNSDLQALMYLTSDYFNLWALK